MGDMVVNQCSEQTLGVAPDNRTRYFRSSSIMTRYVDQAIDIYVTRAHSAVHRECTHAHTDGYQRGSKESDP